MGKGGRSPKQRVTEYFLSIQYGICQGPVDSLNSITINGKLAWTGPVYDARSFVINRPDLFGGIKKEGGVSGRVYWSPGTFTQKSSSTLATKLGYTPSTMPGYRGVANAVFTGEGSAQTESGSGSLFVDSIVGFFNTPNSHSRIGSAKGFLWSANQPVVHPVYLDVTRIPQGWNDDLASVPRGDIGNRSIYLLLDRSESLTSTEFNTIKSAAKDALSLAGAVVAAGNRVDIGVRFWSAGDGDTSIERTNVDAADLSDIETFIDGVSQLTGGDIEPAYAAADAWFRATAGLNFTGRSVVMVTDAGSDNNMTATASGVAADMLNQSSGTFQTNAGTAVECFAINYAQTSTTYTAQLDNTPDDSIPVITGSDVQGLSNAVRRALLSGSGLDANPSHMIRECLTNTSWGMGAPTTAIDDASFLSAAQTLFAEGFGLSMIWSQQDEVQKFVQEILDHIEANLYVDPSTGLFTLKLIRDDYDESALELFDESNCTVKQFQRRSPSEAINEINLTWTNPDTELEETITGQDLGGIVVNNGEIISDNRNYYGVRYAALASRILARDLSAVTAPLATAEISVDRTGWDYAPGSVLKFSSKENNASEIVMRVVKINYGKPGDSKVLASLTQDIFAFVQPTVVSPPETLDEGDDGKAPTALDYTLFLTLNYYLSGYFVSPTSALGAEYPDVFVGFLASTDNTDATGVELVGETVDPAGNISFEVQGTRSLVRRALLGTAMVQEVETTYDDFVNATVSGAGATKGGFGLIGPEDADPEDMELVLFVTNSGATWTIKRGVLDTVPREWPEETPIRFFANNTFIEDDIVRSAFSIAEYKLLMRTTQGLFGFDQAPTIEYTPDERPYLPTRPADVHVNGVDFGLVDADGVDPIPVTWANRNRLTEDGQIMAWDEAGITVESGQTTEIVILDPVDGSEVNRVTGLTGESHDLPVSACNGYNLVDLKIVSRRDGYESHQGSTYRVIVSGGYGYGYGYNYGGT